MNKTNEQMNEVNLKYKSMINLNHRAISSVHILSKMQKIIIGFIVK
jgi:hypothetical protein